MINGVARWPHECVHMTFPGTSYNICNFLVEVSTFKQAIKFAFRSNKFGKSTEQNLPFLENVTWLSWIDQSCHIKLKTSNPFWRYGQNTDWISTRWKIFAKWNAQGVILPSPSWFSHNNSEIIKAITLEFCSNQSHQLHTSLLYIQFLMAPKAIYFLDQKYGLALYLEPWVN